jgi:hypothetical protein
MRALAPKQEANFFSVLAAPKLPMIDCDYLISVRAGLISGALQTPLIFSTHVWSVFLE